MLQSIDHVMRASSIPAVRAVLAAGLAVTTLSFAACKDDAGTAPPVPTKCAALDQTAASAALCKWSDHPGNPVLAPPGEAIVGDPSLLAPEVSPDGRWHLFAWLFTGIVHYASSDGIAWTEVDRPFPIGSVRPYVFEEKGVYHLLFERFSQIVPPQVSAILTSESTDLVTWSEPVTILEPTLDWEKETQSTVGNPFVVARDGEYWLYYSAAGVLLPDTGFTEPRYIGLARAKALRGPYLKEPRPIIAPDAKIAWRNFGSGSMKLLADKYAGRWVALENGIYQDAAGATHSAIQVLESDDGVAWREACAAPPLAPSGDGWKKAFVYAFDTVRRRGDLRVYYNARDGWKEGKERIGFSSLTLPCE